MKVTNAELISSNKRERISGGVYITFISKENITKETLVKILTSCGVAYYFTVTDIQIDGENLKVRAHETGYYAWKMDYKGTDLRTVIGLDVIPVTDKEEIIKINKEACYC